jgi:hypothetical protein
MELTRIEAMTRVLIVEDQRTLLRNLEKGLQEEGYEVLAAASIAEARRALMQQPDLIVCSTRCSRTALPSNCRGSLAGKESRSPFWFSPREIPWRIRFKGSMPKPARIRA